MVSVRRHARDWSAYIAGGGLVLAFFLSLSGSCIGQPQSGSNPSGPTQNSESQPNQPDTSVSSRPLVYSYSCNRPANAEQENLCIELRAAKAAERQAFWADFTAWIAVVGSFAIIITLGYTIRAANAAKKSAETAEKALVDYERPWIFRDVVTVKLRHRPDVQFNDWFVTIKWKNVGRTPALITSFEFALRDADALTALPNYTEMDLLGVVPTLAVKETFHTPQVGPSKDIKPDGTPIQYVFLGRLNYTDMTGRKCQSGFAIRIAPTGASATETDREAAYNYYK